MIANALSHDSPPATPARRPDNRLSVTVSNMQANKSNKAGRYHSPHHRLTPWVQPLLPLFHSHLPNTFFRQLSVSQQTRGTGCQEWSAVAWQPRWKASTSSTCPKAPRHAHAASCPSRPRKVGLTQWSGRLADNMLEWCCCSSPLISTKSFHRLLSY